MTLTLGGRHTVYGKDLPPLARAPCGTRQDGGASKTPLPAGISGRVGRGNKLRSASEEAVARERMHTEAWILQGRGFEASRAMRTR